MADANVAVVDKPQSTVSDNGGANGDAAKPAVQATPSYDPKEIESLKKTAEAYNNLAAWLNANPDALQYLEGKMSGTQTAPPTPAQPAPAVAPVVPQPQVDPIVNHPMFKAVVQTVTALQKERSAASVEREISETQAKFPFLNGPEGRKRLDDAYTQYGQELLKEQIASGKNFNEALQEVKAKQNLLPLDYYVTKFFPKEYAEHLLKSKNQSGMLPPGVGTQADRLGAVKGFQPATTEKYLGAFKSAIASGNTNQMSDIATEVAKEFGIDPNDRTPSNMDKMFSIQAWLQSGGTRALNF